MNDSGTIIDVREPGEYAGGHVEGAINIPLQELQLRVDELTKNGKDKPYTLYCASGNRSGQGINFLQSHGFTNLTNGINQQTIENN